jgi:hypothetical protein
MFNKVVPAVYNSPDLPWGWVNLGELAEIVGLDPLELWDRYFGLTKSLREQRLAVSVDGSVAYHVSVTGDTDLFGPKPWDSTLAFYRILDHLFVPAGWASAVQKAIAAGIYQVEIQTTQLSTVQLKREPSVLDWYDDGEQVFVTVGLDEQGEPVQGTGKNV